MRLPFFKNEIEGFSAEEHTSNRYWWTGNKEQDPWEWCEIIARSGEVAYGKFVHKKAGFISKEWFPYFANYRRDGYDFDARWEDGLTNMRCKKIMDEFGRFVEFHRFDMIAHAMQTGTLIAKDRIAAAIRRFQQSCLKFGSLTVGNIRHTLAFPDHAAAKLIHIIRENHFIASFSA